jgi:NADPH:quinone reductase-like Zn-dependent oxidoreductase
VQIRVEAIGLNRSELFTRQGQSPDVKFPRVLDIEAFGPVEDTPGNEFRHGDLIAPATGGCDAQVGETGDHGPVTRIRWISCSLDAFISGLAETIHDATPHR